MSSDLPLALSSWDDDETEALLKVIASGSFTMGDCVAEFERKFAEFHGAEFAVMTNSGSSANLLMMAACRFGPNAFLNVGDEVIAPAVSWSTTYAPVVQLGMRLRLVDVDPMTLNLTVDGGKRAITSQTKAILAVNLLGNPAPLAELRSLATETGLCLLEDNCESLGATQDGRLAGTFGEMGTFSFFFSHHMSTMEGGAVLTGDKNFYEALVSMRAHGWTRGLPPESRLNRHAPSDWSNLFRFVLPGFNFRPLELEAAVGLEQLRKLPRFLRARRLNAVHWTSVMRGIPGVRIQTENGSSAWFGFSMILEGPLQDERDRVIRALENAGIATRPIVAGNIARHPVAQYLDVANASGLDVADEIHERGLFIGNHHFDVRSQLDVVRGIMMTLSANSV